MTILLNANQQTCVLLPSVAVVILFLTPHPYGPITFILSKPVKAIKEHEHSTPVISAFKKSHLSTKSTLAFRDYLSQQTQAAPSLHSPAETQVRTSVPFIRPNPLKPANWTSQIKTGILTRILSDERVGLYSDSEASTRSQVRTNKPKAFSNRLLRIIPTIALWIGFTVVISAILVAGILSVVYGGLPVPLSPQ